MTRRIEINGERVTVEISESLDAQQLSELLLQLGEARTQIAKDPDNPDGLAMMMAIDPRYFTEPDMAHRSSRIALRHPAFGWMAFLIPAVELARLTGLLTNQLRELTGEAPGWDDIPAGPKH